VVGAGGGRRSRRLRLTDCRSLGSPPGVPGVAVARPFGRPAAGVVRGPSGPRRAGRVSRPVGLSGAAPCPLGAGVPVLLTVALSLSNRRESAQDLRFYGAVRRASRRCISARRSRSWRRCARSAEAAARFRNSSSDSCFAGFRSLRLTVCIERPYRCPISALPRFGVPPKGPLSPQYPPLMSHGTLILRSLVARGDSAGKRLRASERFTTARHGR
jgi:hypothetical protein